MRISQSCIVCLVKQERKNTMKLLIIRHGDPDYTIDSLTEKGHREAEMLAERIAPMDIAAYYVSPLGRAIAADLNGDALDSVCHAVHLLREGMKKAPAVASALCIFS